MPTYGKHPRECHTEPCHPHIAWLRAWFAVTAVLVVTPRFTTAETWPTYRHDASRRAVTSERFEAPLSLRWTFVSSHGPKPAWPLPGEERPRMHSDNALHVAATDGYVYFGSSTTNEIYAIRTASGEMAWRFFTEGPVRFSPTVADGCVYVGSDDGYVYCLDGTDGSLTWKFRLGPSDEKVIGNGRMISLWPVRTSVLVDRDVVYCGAGVFPYEGIYLYALDAKKGTVVWRNDTIGDRAHELSFGGITPHGYLLASEDLLYVPAGRAMPAAFSRKNGEFQFWSSPGGKQGGSWTLLDGDQLIAGVDHSGTPKKVVYNAKSGGIEGEFTWYPGLDMVIDGNRAYILTVEGLYAIDRNTYDRALKEVKASTAKRKTLAKELADLRKKSKNADPGEGETIKKRIKEIVDITGRRLAKEKHLRETSYVWHLAEEELHTVILAGDTLFAGGQGRVVGVDTRQGRRVWESDVAGHAVGLAAAEGHLLVSTDQGRIDCYSENVPKGAPREICVREASNPFAAHPHHSSARETARKIVEQSKITRGYGLVLDCHTGCLAYELCRQTDLRIIALQSDPQKLQTVRDKFRSLGLLGERVIVEAWSLESLPSYFANVILSEEGLRSEKALEQSDTLYRLLRPSGGTLISALHPGAPGPSCQMLRRPPLEGSGNWTQQYGNPQNTACSLDEIAKAPLGVLWFGEPGPLSMVERHAKAQSPLAMDGRLFIQGEEVLMAIDAYNGTLLWRREIPGAVRARVDVDGGNLALDASGLYVTVFDKCLRLDPATGQTNRTYTLPAADGKSHRWGSVTVEEGVLLGVRAEPLKQPYAAELHALHADPNDATLWAYKRANAKWYPMADYPLWENYFAEKGSVTKRMMSGDRVFALDTETGKLLWAHAGTQIGNLTVSLGNGKVFLAEGAVSEPQRLAVLSERPRLVAEGTYVETETMKEADSYVPSDVRIAMALDIKTGKKLWERTVDFTGCCGDAMGSAYSNDVLLFFGCVGNHDAWRWRENQLVFRRIVAMSATSGAVLWSRPLNYRTRPVVIKDRIIIEPRACDLRTGEILMRVDPITGQQTPWEFLRPGHTCAASSASAHTLLYRSHSTALYDLERDAGVAIFGGIRPGCWINMIPASGLVLVPEASVGCTCSFPLRCSYALAHKPQRAQPWTVFINHTELDEKGRVVPQGYGKPVQHLALNFGAPADMKDDEGLLWLAYPNPKTVYSSNHFTHYGLKFSLQEKVLDDMGFYCHDFKRDTIRGTDRPWLFTSGCLGLLRCEIPLQEESRGDGASRYTVRLGFLEGTNPRAFDIKLQGRTVGTTTTAMNRDDRGTDKSGKSGKSDRPQFREFRNIPVDRNLIIELIPQSQVPTQDQAPLLNCVEIIRHKPKV